MSINKKNRKRKNFDMLLMIIFIIIFLIVFSTSPIGGSKLRLSLPILVILFIIMIILKIYFERKNKKVRKWKKLLYKDSKLN